MLHKFQKLLRRNQTDAKALLWRYLRDRGLEGIKFRLQHIIQGYIVDFVCLNKKLIIELDGGQHATQQTYDNKRTQRLEKEGFQVLRVWNNDVLSNMEGVWNIISHTINTSHPPLRGTLSHKGRGKDKDSPQ